MLRLILRSLEKIWKCEKLMQKLLLFWTFYNVKLNISHVQLKQFKYKFL